MAQDVLVLFCGDYSNKITLNGSFERNIGKRTKSFMFMIGFTSRVLTSSRLVLRAANFIRTKPEKNTNELHSSGNNLGYYSCQPRFFTSVAIICGGKMARLKM